MTPEILASRYAPLELSADLVFVPELRRGNPPRWVMQPYSRSAIPELTKQAHDADAREIADALDLLAADLAAPAETGRLRMEPGRTPWWEGPPPIRTATPSPTADQAAAEMVGGVVAVIPSPSTACPQGYAHPYPQEKPTAATVSGESGTANKPSEIVAP